MLALNNWDTKYTSIVFLERALSTHQRVRAFAREQDIRFIIDRKDDFGSVVAVLVGRYTISLADVIAAKAEFPDMQCMVAYGNWCGYTEEAKTYGLSNDIGVFQIGEFLGALFTRSVVTFAQKDSNGRPYYHYRAA
jgi:hypothetical protein